jgi:hypothetical protein
MAALSPDKILSAPMFFPLVGQPYFSCLKIEQLENIQQQATKIIIFFITNSVSNKPYKPSKLI